MDPFIILMFGQSIHLRHVMEFDVFLSKNSAGSLTSYLCMYLFFAQKTYISCHRLNFTVGLLAFMGPSF